ncbi:hypothetical protein A0O36_02724 [Piscirickettsiaceae bacterium NZ-RLO1]|nr:hypothetical protein A0O36_02724 [Piscirickettsiaceae bacterium NZ-RLO1]
MPHIEVNWPQCSENDVIKFGRNASGSQRYKCKNTDCDKDTFLLNYKRPGDLPETKEKIIDMSMNGSGIRDIARVLKISTNTVMKELKKARRLDSVNTQLLNGAEERKVELVCANDIELDEMWSFVGHKKNQRWLWHAIDHSTGKILAYHFGRRKDEALIVLKF